MTRWEMSKTNDPEIYREWLWELKDRHDRVAEKYPLFEYSPSKKLKPFSSLLESLRGSSLSLKEKFSIFRPIRIYPVLEKELKEVTQPYRHVIVIEGNDGQYASWVEWATGRKVMRVPCLGGGFKLRWIQNQIEERLKQEGG